MKIGSFEFGRRSTGSSSNQQGDRLVDEEEFYRRRMRLEQGSGPLTSEETEYKKTYDGLRKLGLIPPSSWPRHILPTSLCRSKQLKLFK